MKTIKYLLILILTGSSMASFSQDKIDLLILNGNYHQALQQIENKLQKESVAELHFKKGLIYSSLQNYQEAINAFTAALAIEPQNPEILGEMAEAQSTLGNYIDAIPYYKRALRQYPQNLQLAGKLGRNFINLKNYRESYNVFSDIYKIDSTNIYWNKQFAFSAYQINNRDLAVYLYRKVIELNPRDYSSYFNLIKLYLMQEKQDDAFAVIQLGLHNFPGDNGFYLQEAGSHFALKNYEEARKVYDKYFISGGDSIYKELLNYGISLYFVKDVNKAVSILEKCADMIANDPFALFYLSLSHKKLNQYEIAEAYMDAAIESATPSYLPEMYHHLGQIYGQQRKFEESIIALRKAHELDPTNHEVLFEIATTYEEYNSNKTLALNYYQIYLKEAGESGRNLNYALDRIERIKEDLFFEK